MINNNGIKHDDLIRASNNNSSVEKAFEIPKNDSK